MIAHHRGASGGGRPGRNITGGGRTITARWADRDTPTRSGVSRVSAVPPIALVPCGSCTPPTGTWGGPSTGGTCWATRTVLASIADLVADERVDVVVLPGDLYDRAVPSGEAVETCVRALSRIREAGAQIVITPGNHDSAARVGAFADFAAAGGLHLRTRISRLHQPVVLTDQHGPVAFYGIPYLEPDPARHALNACADVPGAAQVTQRGHEAVLTEAMNRVRADLAERAGCRSVVLAHAHQRRRPQRFRTDDRGRRGGARAGGRLPRRRLHRPGPPARAAGAETAPALLRKPWRTVLRSGATEIGVAGRIGRERARRGGTPRTTGSAAAGHRVGAARRAAHRTPLRRTGRPLPVHHPHRRRPPPGGHAPAAAALPARGAPGMAAGQRAGHRTAALRRSGPQQERPRAGGELRGRLPRKRTHRIRANAARPALRAVTTAEVAG